MKVVIQRVKEAKVEIDNKIYSEIKNGLLIFLGITEGDTKEDIAWLTNKIVNLRIFDDKDGIMNKSILETSGDIITVSQFTLFARTKKGNRPSYIDAARPEIAIPLYEQFICELDILLGKKSFTGSFGADMKVCLCNDGPVTIIIDSKEKR